MAFGFLFLLLICFLGFLPLILRREDHLLCSVFINHVNGNIEARNSGLVEIVRNSGALGIKSDGESCNKIGCFNYTQGDSMFFILNLRKRPSNIAEYVFFVFGHEAFFQPRKGEGYEMKFKTNISDWCQGCRPSFSVVSFDQPSSTFCWGY